jgi:predicted GIY-YIG superfamily endonuclease
VTALPDPQPHAVEITGEPTAVYRFYDRCGGLLYIGISHNLAMRFANHAGEKTWWPEVARKTVVMYGSRTEAEEAESAAILAESPRHNIAGRKAKAARRAHKPAQPVLARYPAGSDTFRLGPGYLAMVDAYAEKRGIGRDDAIPKLLFNSLMDAELEEFEGDTEALATLEEKADSLGLEFPRWARQSPVPH